MKLHLDNGFARGLGNSSGLFSILRIRLFVGEVVNSDSTVANKRHHFGQLYKQVFILPPLGLVIAFFLVEVFEPLPPF